MESHYYKVAIVTMILGALFAGVGLFLSILNSEKAETEVTQGSNSESFVVHGNNNIIQKGSMQEDMDTYDDPLSFQNDDLRLAHIADLMEQKKYDDAISFSCECLQLPDMNVEMKNCVNFNLGLCLLMTGENDNQAANLLGEVANQAKQAEVYYYLCHALIRAKSPIDALNAIEKAIELDNQAKYRELRDILCADTHVAIS